jgi:TolB-like protein
MGEAPGSDVKLSQQAASLVRFAGLVLNLDACMLSRNSGEAIPLTRGEFAVLRMFVARPGRVISRDTLLDAFANRLFEPFDRSVDVLVGKLRRKIEADPKSPRLIVTVPGEGYRFDGLRFRVPAIVTPDADSSSKRVGPPRLSIVVLPFANIGGEPEQEYFADGVTESLTTDLSRMRGAFVISRSTAFTYRGKAGDVREIGRELNVRYVLVGSVQRSGKRLRVNVQLVEAETGAHLWAERFDKPIADFFNMQDEIVARLANQLAVELIGSEARRSQRTPAPDSFDLFLQGVSWFHRGPTPENLVRAQGCFEHALALDPDNVGALVKMSMVDFQYAEFLFSKDRAARLATAEKTSVKALRLAPEHALAHLSLGPVLCVTNRVEAGIAECERALALDPNLAAAHGAIGAFKAHIGRDEETEPHVREALRLSPRDGSVFIWLMFVGGANINLGRYEEAIVWLSRSIEANGNNPLCHFHLAGTYALLGRLEESRAAARTGLALNPDFRVARFRASPSSDTARYAAAHELFADALLTAGVPEQ